MVCYWIYKMMFWWCSKRQGVHMGPTNPKDLMLGQWTLLFRKPWTGASWGAHKAWFSPACLARSFRGAWKRNWSSSLKFSCRPCHPHLWWISDRDHRSEPGTLTSLATPRSRRLMQWTRAFPVAKFLQIVLQLLLLLPCWSWKTISGCSW